MYTPAQAREFAEDMGSFPFMDADEVIRSLADQVEALEAQLAAVGAGGVQRYRLEVNTSEDIDEICDPRGEWVKFAELTGKASPPEGLNKLGYAQRTLALMGDSIWNARGHREILYNPDGTVKSDTLNGVPVTKDTKC